MGGACHPSLASELCVMISVSACRERYDVDLVLTKFEGSMYDTMKLMATTDLFMGMHGAGFTNVLYLPPVRVRRSGASG